MSSEILCNIKTTMEFEECQNKVLTVKRREEKVKEEKIKSINSRKSSNEEFIRVKLSFKYT